jgi:hypothetical protein
MRTARVAILVTALAAIGVTTPAHAANSTSANVTTWVGGQQSPAAAGSATWDSGGTQLDVRAFAPPAAITRVLATWTGPTKWFNHNADMLTVDATVRDQPIPTSPGLMVTEQTRICAKKCGRWVAGHLDASPYLDLSSVPPSPSDEGFGLTLTWPGKRAKLHVEWRLTATVPSGDAATVQVSVSG